jgi:hypothetical protein
MLTFNLKKEWFEKIKRGDKTHEYREVKPYWTKRISKELFKQPLDFSFTNGYNYYSPSRITFVCGYAPKEDKSKRLQARLKSIDVINGKDTDLKIDKPVFDIEFELIKE